MTEPSTPPPASTPAPERSPAPSALSIPRSIGAVFAGYVTLLVLRFLFMAMAGALFSSLYPSEEGASPTAEGLVLLLVGDAVNGALAGLVAGRIAGRATFAHAAALAGLCGYLAMTSMDQVAGMPGWFALGFALAAPLGILAGGLAAGRVIARAPAAASPPSPPEEAPRS